MKNINNKTLTALLLKSGIKQSAEEIIDILAGVAGGPAPESAMGKTDAWLNLVATDISQELAEVLKYELERISHSYGDSTANQGSDIFKQRLISLRAEMEIRDISGFIIPLADEHQGEYVPKNAQRLAWITGFTGSAGFAVVLKNKAAIFVDGRYTLQVKEEVDEKYFDINSIDNDTFYAWISSSLSPDSTIGFDPWLHTADGIIRIKKAVEKSGGKLKSLRTNPIDEIWKNRPKPPLTPVKLMDKMHTGQTSLEKRNQISKVLKEEGIGACVLTAPDSISWLANIRGSDVPYTPFSLSFAIFHADKTLDLYNDQRKFSAKVLDQLGEGINLFPREEFLPALRKMGGRKERIGIDLSSSAKIIADTLKNSGAAVHRFSDPCQLPKAKKNSVELSGMRRAHLRDGVALTKFLAWLEENASSGRLTELSTAKKLESFRREENEIQGLSFPTISGSGPNGAIVHYRVTEKSDRNLSQNSLYLVDSGGQYIDGTTDVTRTIAIGKPTSEMKDRFTRVLKGHIALAKAVFPYGTSGSQLDILARRPLWEIGLDYDHGTGHGVGSYLSVHEGPQRISKLPNQIALEPGMVLSNEPGYYKKGEYGIRIENLVAVTKRQPSDSTKIKHASLCFETLTLAPIDLILVDKTLLIQSEIDWLNEYHRNVRDNLSPLLDKKTKTWLKLRTAEIMV